MELKTLVNRVQRIFFLIDELTTAERATPFVALHKRCCPLLGEQLDDKKGRAM